MRTDELIEGLAADLRPAGRNPARGLGLAVAVGGAFSLAGLAAWLGARPLDDALARGLAMKAAYALVLAASGWIATVRLARPGGGAGLAPYAVAAAFGLLLALGAAQMATLGASEARGLMMGATWLACPLRIVALSTPVLAAVLVWMRRLAPTRVAAAGAAAGLLSGALAAAVYGLHCGEAGTAFIAVWYTAGVILTAGVGALTGRAVLRW